MTNAENTIDTLMDLMDQDPLLLQPRDIDEIIAYHRKARTRAATGGGKPKRESGPKLELGNLLGSIIGEPAPKAPTIKRRV